MTRPPALSPADYSDADRTELPTLMTALVAELTDLLTAHAPEGRWPSNSDGFLEQLRSADELLDQAARAVTAARSGVRRIDGHARDRFLARTVHHASVSV